MAKNLKNDGDAKYAVRDEKFDRKRQKKDDKHMNVAGLATSFKMSEKDMGYSKAPKVKPQKKVVR